MKQTNKLSFVSNSDAYDILLKWWKGLDDSRGDRASLRRCHNSIEVAFNPAFHHLRWSLSKFDYVNPESLAIVAGVLSHVKNNDGSARFAAQMAMPKSGGTNTRVSGLRFRRLLKVQNNSDLFEPLIRVVRMLDGNVNISSLANSIYWWNDFTRKDWAFAYYDKAPDET